MPKITDTIKRATLYTPKAKIPLLVSEKAINTSAVPYVMGEDQSWNELSLLMLSDTAHLVRELHIPRHGERWRIDELTSLLRKRGMEHFYKLTIPLSLIRDIRNRLSPFHLQSLQYKIEKSCNDIEIWFPSFTRDIEMLGGIIQNIPDRIVNLKLTWIDLDRSCMEAIGQARFLTSLELEAGEIAIRGLPEFLEKLILKSIYGITFESPPAVTPAAERARPSVPALAGSPVRPAALESDALPESEGTPAAERALEEESNYNYYCEYLTHFEHNNTAAEIRLPTTLISSMATSLRYLSVRGSPYPIERSLSTILNKLENLEELRFDRFTVVDYTVPISTKILTITSSCLSLDSDRLNPLPALEQLNMPCTKSFLRMMTGILQTSPLLKSLRTVTESRAGSEPLLPTGFFPQVKTFCFEANEFERTIIMWNRSNELFRVFPNLNTVECLQKNNEWKADFTKKELYINTSSYNNEDFSSLRNTEFQKFHFRFYSNKRLGELSLRSNLRLPQATTQVTLTFCGYKKNSDGYLSQDYSTDTTIQYDIQELQRKSGVTSPGPVILEAFSDSDRIYADFSLENGRYVDHLFGQYKPPGSDE